MLRSPLNVSLLNASKSINQQLFLALLTFAIEVLNEKLHLLGSGGQDSTDLSTETACLKLMC